MCIYTCMHACLWADLYLCLSLLLHLLLSLSFFLDIYMYLFHWPQEGELEGPNRKARRVRTGARIQQIYFVGHGARLGLGNGSIYILVSMVEDVVVVAAPVLVLANPPCGIASSLAAIFVYSTLYSILRK